MGEFIADIESLVLRDDGFLLSLVFLAVVIAVFAVFSLMRRDEVALRLAQAGRPGGAGGAVSLRYQEANLRQQRLLKRLQKSFGTLSEKERSALKRKLVRAGFMNPRAPLIYYLARISCAVFLPVLILVAGSVFFAGLEFNILILISIAACLVGHMLPHFIVRVRTNDRQRIAREGFPDALDMMLVCVEAGLGLSAAIDRISNEMARSNPVLAEHFTLVNLEVRAGTSRADALKNFADRAGVTEISALVTLLIQSESLGTSVADSLRVYASEMRSKRLIRAEEIANKLPVKMALPLGFAILPCLIIVIMTPMIIRMVRDVFPVLGGG